MHHAVVVAQIGTDEQLGRARRPDAHVRRRSSPNGPGDVVGRPDGRVQHLAAAHGCVVEGRARAGLDELVAVKCLRVSDVTWRKYGWALTGPVLMVVVSVFKEGGSELGASDHGWMGLGCDIMRYITMQ